jgi:hypothetical protein
LKKVRINDGIGGAETFENAFKDSKSIKADLSKFGFYISRGKMSVGSGSKFSMARFRMGHEKRQTQSNTRTC